MKFFKAGLSLAVVGTALAVVPAASSTAVGVIAADKPSLERQMRAEADGTVLTSTDAATGLLDFVRVSGGSADLLPADDARSRTDAVAKATAYLDEYAPAFGATGDQLRRLGVVTSDAGTTVDFVQEHRGVPVFGSLLRAHLDRQGDLTSVNGTAVPVPADLSVEPRLDQAAGGAAAVRQVRANPPVEHNHGPGASHGGDRPASVDGIRAKTTELVVYRNGLVRGVEGKSELVYRVEVSNDANIRDIVFVSADTGKLVNRYSLVHGALDRELSEATGTAQAPVITPVWKEGDPYPGDLNAEQRNLVEASGESYYFFANSFGRDSYDDEGARMRTVNNDPRISCPNANWNGTTTNYCNGVTSDDVVAHEWGHAYTEYTWGGIYQWQPGALNEAYSDIWGETVDLLNGREDEGEGDITAKRPDGVCSKFTRGAIGATINSPASVAGPCAAAAAAAFGPVFDKAGTTTDVVVATDEANPTGPSTTDGCTAFSNAAAIAGKFAYVDRGTCTFAVKTANADAAGATGIVVGDNAPDRAPIAMSGDSDLYGLMVTQADGTKIKSAGTVNMTVKDVDEGEKAQNSRWLVGEKSTAFGGAIRDMWNPTCYGDPGKVSDVQYHCTPDDAGGVHSNSGVPNHGFALLVDGGTYNGVTVPAIGHTKAAHIYYRAMTEYQTPVSDFTDHADALESACTDLVGTELTGLGTAGSPEDTDAPAPLADETLVAADCAAIPEMAKAVELRKPPTQCNFQPLLAKGELSPCGRGFVTETTVIDDFEDGLDAWTLEEELAVGATEGFDWQATDEAPAGREGSVAWAQDPDAGSCAPGDDISSRNSMISPELTVPAGQNVRVAVDHYVATEAGYDGGNVKASVNGSPFQTLPAAAFLFNPYNTTLTSAAGGNTSPIAGQPGFSGTDGGELTGSWGQSVISLSRLGLVAGDKVKIRFDFGRDGCGGLPTDVTPSGWYLDNLTLTLCKEIAEVTAAHQPDPSRYGTESAVVVSAPEAATGDVTLSVGGKTVGTDELVDGAASIPVPAFVPSGTGTWTVSYAGDDAFGAAETPVTVTIARAGTTPAITSFPRQLKAGRRAVVQVEVETPAGMPAGRVALKRNGKTWGTAVLRSGEATVRTTPLARAGSYVFRPAFLGGRNYAPSLGRAVTIRVTR